MVTLEANAGRVIKSIFAERGCQPPLRIELRFSGCCDPALGLRADKIRESDLVQRLEELTFVIRPELDRLLGEVKIAFRDEPGRKGFILTALKPVSEWEGFAVSLIRF